jgi:flap endonuclease-1
MSRLEDLIEVTPHVRQIYQRALNMPSASDHDACRDLVVKMGVPVLEACIPYEAEGLAASLANAGLVDFVGSEDSDVLAYEVGHLLCKGVC